MAKGNFQRPIELTLFRQTLWNNKIIWSCTGRGGQPLLCQ